MEVRQLQELGFYFLENDSITVCIGRNFDFQKISSLAAFDASETLKKLEVIILNAVL